MKASSALDWEQSWRAERDPPVPGRQWGLHSAMRGQGLMKAVVGQKIWASPPPLPRAFIAQSSWTLGQITDMQNPSRCKKPSCGKVAAPISVHIFYPYFLSVKGNRCIFYSFASPSFLLSSFNHLLPIFSFFVSHQLSNQFLNPWDLSYYIFYS